jgi:hypothetical protein
MHGIGYGALQNIGIEKEEDWLEIAAKGCVEAIVKA